MAEEDLSEKGKPIWARDVELFIYKNHGGCIPTTTWQENDIGVWTCLFSQDQSASYMPELDRLMFYTCIAAYTKVL